MTDRDYMVTVCASCLRAGCWHGELMCDEARDADTKDVKASELRRLGREHPDWYSPSRILKVTGMAPVWI